jgi:hypothetical protein
MLGSKTRNHECIVFADQSAKHETNLELVKFIKNQYKINAELYETEVDNYPYTISFF